MFAVFIIAYVGIGVLFLASLAVVATQPAPEFPSQKGAEADLKGAA